jgi:hypothetical protein
MGMKTYQQVIDEIVYELYAGLPGNDRSISDNFVLRKVNNFIAEAAMKSAFGTNNLDAVVEADDSFRLTYPLTLSVDTSTGLKTVPMPASPVGIPSMRSYIVYPPAQYGGRASTLFKPIYASEVSRIRSQPRIRKVFYWNEDGNLWFIDSFQIMNSYNNVNLSLVTSGVYDLTAFLNVPDDMIHAMKVSILPELRAMKTVMDTDPLPAADNPQPR